MTSVLFIALVIAVTGFEALLADVEAIPQPDASPYLGPAMVVGAGWSSSWPRPPASARGTPA